MMLFASASIAGSGALVGASPMFSDGANVLGAWISLSGVAGLVAGFLLIRRIGRSIDESEGHRSPWRFRGTPKPGPSFREPTDTDRQAGDMTGRGLRGRLAAQRILLAAIVLDGALAVLLFAWAPQCACPMMSEPPRFMWLIPAFGIALNLAGLAWMIRIVRADPERHASFWRSKRS